MSKPFGRMSILLASLLICVGCDQATKTLAQQHLASKPPTAYWGNLFRFEYAENPGAFLSLGVGLPEPVRFGVFVVGVAFLLAIGVLVLFRFRNQAPLPLLFALSLVLGGGLSNFLSRVLNEGRVIDFMNVGIGSLRTGVFNVADMAIMAGLFLVLIFNFANRGVEQRAPTS